jgi:hypothetical protein
MSSDMTLAKIPDERDHHYSGAGQMPRSTQLA